MSEMKKCMRCERRSSLVDFNRDRREPDGLGTVCRTCRKIEAAERSALEARRRAEQTGADGMARLTFEAAWGGPEAVASVFGGAGLVQSGEDVRVWLVL